MLHHRRVLFTMTNPETVPLGHVGYLAGRYRDGAYSDVWTDVSRCAEGTFVGYAGACTCGWRGAGRPLGPLGRVASRRQWAAHLAEVGSAVRMPAGNEVAAPAQHGADLTG